MREVDDQDPKYVLAISMAAIDMLPAMSIHNRKSRNIVDTLHFIEQLRASACGFREAEIAFKSDYRGRKPRDARHDAKVCAKHAREADQRADKLCKQVGLPVEHQGRHEALAKQLWEAWRNIWVAVQDCQTAWMLIAATFARWTVYGTEQQATLVTHGGTPEQLEAYNVKARAAMPVYLAAVASRDDIEQQLSNAAMEAGCRQVINDKELRGWGHDAATLLKQLDREYLAAIDKAKAH